MSKKSFRVVVVVGGGDECVSVESEQEHVLACGRGRRRGGFEKERERELLVWKIHAAFRILDVLCGGSLL